MDFSSLIWKLLTENVYSDFLWIIVIINFGVVALQKTFYIDPLFIRLDSANALWAPMRIGWWMTLGVWVPLGRPYGGRWHETIAPLLFLLQWLERWVWTSFSFSNVLFLKDCICAFMGSHCRTSTNLVFRYDFTLNFKPLGQVPEVL